MNFIYNNQIISNLKIVFLISLFYCPTGSKKTVDLSMVCLFTFNSYLPVYPNCSLCTAVGTFSSLFGDKTIDLSCIRKQNLPFVLIYDNYQNCDDCVYCDAVGDVCFSDIGEIYQSYLHITSGIKECLQNYKPDVLILDFNITKHDDGVDEFINQLRLFCSDVRVKYPDLSIGLSLPNTNYVPQLTKTFDFFYVKTYDYTNCIYQNHQLDMVNYSATPDDVKNTIQCYINQNLDPKILYPVIEVLVKSYQKNNAKSYDYFTNSYICSATDLNVQCSISLENLYQQAVAIRSLKLGGCFINAFDNDDYNGSCTCGDFPATRVIHDGLNGIPENKGLTGCTKFGIQLND